MKPVGKPDAGNPHVRFDERGWETGRRSASAPAPNLDSTGFRTGQPFWQAESYIENSPVKAGLVANPEDHLWSSTPRKAEMTLGSAGSTACATKLR